MIDVSKIVIRNEECILIDSSFDIDNKKLYKFIVFDKDLNISRIYRFKDNNVIDLDYFEELLIDKMYYNYSDMEVKKIDKVLKYSGINLIDLELKIKLLSKSDKCEYVYFIDLNIKR